MARYSYKRFLIQKENAFLNDGVTPNDTTVHDSDEWNIRIMNIPFRVKGSAKDLPSNDWHGEHGKETFIPDVIPMQDYKTDCKMVYKGKKGNAGVKIKAFLDYLSNGGYFKIYIERFKIGRQHVRYIDYDPNAVYINDDDENTEADDIIEFTVSLNVDDPETDVVLELKH